MRALGMMFIGLAYVLVLSSPVLAVKTRPTTRTQTTVKKSGEKGAYQIVTKKTSVSKNGSVSSGTTVKTVRPKR